MGRKPKKRTGLIARVQIEISLKTLEHIEGALAKLDIHGHKAIFKTGGMLIAKLVEKSLGKGFVRVRILEGGLLEFEEEAPRSLESQGFPTGHASKATRLEHGMQPNPSP